MGLERDYLESAKRRLSNNGVFDKLMQLDEKLKDTGFPPMSPWWRRTFEDFYKSGKRQLVLRVGRRGGKSSSLCRVGVSEALWGDHQIPAGDIGVVAIVSVNKPQAAERIRTIETILKAIRVPHKRTGDVIELQHKPVKFEVMAATTLAAVGFTSICVICDEVALWRDQDGSANPAERILGFLRPTLMTMPRGKMFLSSSPFSTLDSHHKAFVTGDDARQMVRHAATWEANPTLSEAATHIEEPDQTEWLRQYAAIPMSAGSLSFFDPIAIDRAIDTKLLLPLAPKPGDVVTAGGDFGFRSDSSALALAYKRGEIYHTAELLELRPGVDEPLKPSVVVKTFAEVLKRHGCAYLCADGHYRQSISEHLEVEDLHFTIAPEGAKGNQEVYVRFRRLLLDGQIKLPKHDRLIDQLKLVTSQPTAGGAISIKQPRQTGGGHGDLVSALVLACYQRGGSDVAGPKVKFGTPEYWKQYNSPEAINAREEENIAKEEEEYARREERHWWEDT
jgi:hypothetical protein